MKNLKLLFTLIIIIALGYLVYWYINLPEEKLGEITFKKDITKKVSVDTKPTYVASLNQDINANVIETYKIQKNFTPPITQAIATDIISVLGLQNNKIQEHNYDQANVYIARNENSTVSVSSLGTFTLETKTNLKTNTTTKDIIKELETLNITKVLPLPANYDINTYKSHYGGIVFEISKILPNNTNVRTFDNPYMFWGIIEEYESYNQITINADLNFNTTIIDESTYKIISTKEAINLANNNDPRIIIDIKSTERHIDFISTNKLIFNKATIEYFIQDNLLVPYIKLSGNNQFNNIDTGLVSVYVPAIEQN